MTALSDAPTGPRYVYTGRATSWPLVASTSIAGLLLVLMGRPSGAGWSAMAIPLVLVGVGVAANVLTASSVRATAGPNGFTIHWGLVGWPRCTYRVADIERAGVIDLPWWKVSWGLWWTPRRTSCTVRSGPTVERESMPPQVAASPSAKKRSTRARAS